MAQPAAYGSSQLPPGGVIYGPFPHPHLFAWFRWAPAAMLFIAAGLIFANAVALLYPPFFFTWIGFFPWVAQLGSFAFILGIVLGIVLLGAVILFLLGFRVLAAFVIFPTALVSLLIGGGFLAGLILAVLAGVILLTLNDKPWHM